MSILDEIVAHKRQELGQRRREVSRGELERRSAARPAPRDFTRALTPEPGGVRLLAEVKKASPSRGVLAESFDPLALAEVFAANGAAALSVLTDEKYFQGSLEFLTAIRDRVETPILRKDFTLDEYQVWEARAAGADAVLLIVSILDGARLRDLQQVATGLGLAALVEAHTASEIDVALTAGAFIVGINNRDLKTFETRIETSLELLPLIPRDVIAVSESGFFSADQVRKVVAAGAHAVLVGEALVRAPDVAGKVRELALGGMGGHFGAPHVGR
jgi:indole-3-glycerol phosphate synthase